MAKLNLAKLEKLNEQRYIGDRKRMLRKIESILWVVGMHHHYRGDALAYACKAIRATVVRDELPLNVPAIKDAHDMLNDVTQTHWDYAAAFAEAEDEPEIDVEAKVQYKRTIRVIQGRVLTP